jgi:hypothetical protein
MGSGTVVNGGDIYNTAPAGGNFDAVVMFQFGLPASLVNSGKIVSGSRDGVHLYNNTGATFTLTNSGLIQGIAGQHSFFGGDAN